MTHPQTLAELNMPAQVSHMPLSWYCPIRGRDIAIGYRVWAGTPTIPYGMAFARIEREADHYKVFLHDPAGWFEAGRFGFDRDIPVLDARARAIDLAEWHESEIFNSFQPDPRELARAEEVGA